ncbi:tail assembly chaperone [Lactiplantibacillus plantarum]|uniref:tail assembly chaperone n=2 Tax=Lactiplantibacillus plantarum TaxID=1590 RepID=UPI001C02A1A9|nr:tail assembly chaperone [Lactiplantibacillus plantarum]MBT9655983.1 hypothetical protein [Lactiplantibacillus plantarum]
MENLMIDGTTCTPKLNYAFANQVKKELSENGRDGFDVLVDGLLDEDPDQIVNAYYYALAYFKRSQPSRDKVVEALEDTIFADDDKTNSAYSDIIQSLHADNFLARKLTSFVKGYNKILDIMQKKLESETEGSDQYNQDQLGMEQLQTQLDKLKKVLQPGTPQSATPEVQA